MDEKGKALEAYGVQKVAQVALWVEKHRGGRNEAK